MLKDITLGQYFPGNSPIHRLDARIKVVGSVLLIVAIFLARNIWGYAALILASILLIAVSRLPFKTIIKSFKALVFIIAFTAFINVFLTKGETELFGWKFIHIYYEGIMYAVMMVVRISVLLVVTSIVLTYTTSPIDMTDALERLLSPLKKIKVPVHEFAMMMTIALRFIPTLIEETDKIMSAQKARGADFSSGKLTQRVKALIPVLIPLFISAFRRADDLAMAMECRCYHGGEGRTRMKILHLHTSDFVFLFFIVAFGAVLILLNRYAPGYKM